jgi:hypothetical protein
VSKDRGKDKTKMLRDKCHVLGAALRRSRTRIRDLERGRDKYKQKYQHEKKRNAELERQLASKSGSKAKKHQFSLWVSMYAIMLLNYSGMSLRGCQKSLNTLFLVLNVKGSVPSHETIRRWRLKVGFWYSQQMKTRKDLSTRLAIVVYESITIGTERLLCVLAIDLNTWNFDKAPALQDMQMLHVGVAKEWKAEQVAEIIQELSTRYNIVASTSDAGNNLLKMFKLRNLFHVPDCSHAVANILEKHLLSNTSFAELMRLTGDLRQIWMTSQYAFYAPPQKRGKSRFMNISPIIDWSYRTLQKRNSLPAVVQQKTEWLVENQDFVKEITALTNLIKAMFGILKVKGGSIETVAQVRVLALKANLTGLVKGAWEDIDNQYLKVVEQKAIEFGGTVLCCSDIIESLFGKYKYRLPNRGASAEKSAMTIPLFTANLTHEEIKVALQSVRFEDVKNGLSSNKAAA